MQIKYGLDNMWYGMLQSSALPDIHQIRSGLVTGYSQDELNRIQQLSHVEFKPIELASSIVRAMRLFYRLPLEMDIPSLTSYLDNIQKIRLDGKLRGTTKLKSWSEFLTGAAPPKLNTVGRGFQESYIWAVLHFLAAYGTRNATSLLRHLSHNLINILQCFTCKMHLTMNKIIDLKYRSNLLISIDSANELVDTFNSTCQFHNDINDINKKVGVNVCRSCSLNCNMRMFPTATMLRDHRVEDYKNRLSQYREIIEMSDDSFNITLLNS